MLIIFIILQSIYTYYINKDELKVFDYYIQQSENYNLIKDRIKEYRLGSIDEKIEIIQVATEFDDTLNKLNIALLTKNLNDTFIVYSFSFDKLLTEEITFNKQYLYNQSFCNGICYFQKQFVVSCGCQFYFSNKTIINLDKKDLENTLTFYSYHNGFVVRTQKSIYIFDNHFKLLNIILNSYQNTLQIGQYFYHLSFNNVQITTIDMQQEIQQIILECQEEIKAFSVFLNQIFISCNQIQNWKNNYSNFEIIYVQGNNLSQTNRFLIVDQSLILNKQHTNNIVYQDQNKLYSLNYLDYLIKQDQQHFYIIELLDYSVISPFNATSNFQVDNLEFNLVNYGIQEADNKEFKNQQMFQQIDFYQYDWFAIGNDLTVSGDCLDEKMISYKSPDILKNVNLLGVTISNNQAVFVFEKNQKIYVSTCFLRYPNIYPEECKPPNNIWNGKFDKIIKPQLISNNYSNQYHITTFGFILVIEEKKYLNIFINQHLIIQQLQVNNFCFDEKYLIIEKTVGRYFNIEIHNFVNSSLLLEEIIQLNHSVVELALGNSEIYILNSLNQLLYIKKSIIGWNIIFQEQLVESPIRILFALGQFFIIFKNYILIYQYQINRGQINYEILNAQYYQASYQCIYIRNATHILQIYNQNQISLSSSLLRVMKFSTDSMTRIISYSTKDYIIVRDHVYVLPIIKKFQIDSISDKDKYFQLVPKILNFKNSFNDQKQIEVLIVASHIKLFAKVYETDIVIVDNNTSQFVLQMNEYFDGSISNFYLKKSQDVNLTLNVYQKSNQLSFLKDYLVIEDLLDYGNNSLLILNSSEIFICSDYSKCFKLQQFKFSLNCKELQQNQQNVYIICRDQIYYYSKTQPQKLHVLKTPNDQIRRMKAENDLIVILKNDQLTFILDVYKNNKLSFSKEMYKKLMDFIIYNNKIYLLHSDILVIIDQQLNQMKINLLEQLMSQINQTNLKFDLTYLFSINNDRFLIATSLGQVFEIEIKFDKQINYLRQYVTLMSSSILEMQIFDNQIIAIVFLQTNQRLALFYQLSQDKIVPYFQCIEIQGKISKVYIKKYQTDSFFIKLRTGILEYQTNKYISIDIKQTGNFNLTLVAEDFNIQQAEVKINIKDLRQKSLKQNESIINTHNMIITLILVFITLYLILRCIRRWILIKKQKKIIIEQSSIECLQN